MVTPLIIPNSVSVCRDQDWKKQLDLKTMYHQCIMYFYLGCQSEEQEKHGERLAYFTAATEKLAECLKLAKVSMVRHEYQTQTLQVNHAYKDHDRYRK